MTLSILAIDQDGTQYVCQPLRFGVACGKCGYRYVAMFQDGLVYSRGGCVVCGAAISIHYRIEVPAPMLPMFIWNARQDPQRWSDPNRQPLAILGDHESAVPESTIKELVALAKAGNREDFDFLAGSAGVEDRDALWAGTRSRLGK